MSIAAIIPARGGSKGVPGKNLRKLGGYPLIAYSVAIARMLPEVSRAIVSTDSEEIAAEAARFGGEVPFLRPAEISGDKSTDSEFMRHALDWFGTRGGGLPSLLLHLRPTTPLRDPSILSDAIAVMGGDAGATSLRSAHEAPETPFKWFLKGEDGYFSGILPGLSGESLNRPRQDFPKAYVPDGYVDIIRPDLFLETGALHGDKIRAYISPVCREVDVPEDFDYLEYAIRKEGSPLLDYLRERFPL